MDTEKHVTFLKSPVSRAIALHFLLILLLLSPLFISSRTPYLDLTTALEPSKVQWVDMTPNSAPMVETEKGKETEKSVEDAKWSERTQVVDRETVLTGQQKAGSAKSSGTKGNSRSLEKFGLNYTKLGPQAQAKLDSEAGDAQYGQRAKEYVKGYKEGDKTLLNTKEFVFFGYFQRIREGLNRAWEPILKEKIEDIYRAGRQLASETEHMTRVYVVLDRIGSVVDVLVLDDSGTRQLDEAAVQAFKKAGPFPNPPKGLLDSDGQVRVRWEFILRT